MTPEQAEIHSQFKAILEKLHELPVQQRADILKKLQVHDEVFELAPSFQELKTRYDLAVEGTNDGIWDWNILSGHVFYSDRWAQVLGYDSAQELEPTIETWRNHIHPDDYDLAVNPVEEHLSGANRYMPEAVYRMVKKDGSVIYTAHRGKAKFNEENKAIRMVGTTRDVDFKIKLSNELQEQNRFINSILNHSPQLIFVKDKWGKFLKVNQSTSDLLGKPIEEIENENNLDLHDNQDELKAYDEVDKQVLNSLKPISVEEKFTDSNGETRVFQTVKTPLVRPSGEVDILGISNDITELKASQVKLLKQEREFRNILESLPVVIGRLDHNFQFKYFNPALVKYLSFSRLEDTIQLSIKNLIYKDDLPSFLQAGRSIFSHSEHNKEGRIRVKKGDQFFWFDYSMSLQEYPDSYSELLVSLHDVSEQIRYSQDLERNQRIFGTIAENSTDIIGLHSGRGYIKYVSPAVTKLLGYSENEILGKQALSLLHPEDTSVVKKLIFQMKEGQTTNNYVQTRMKHKNGSYRWMEITASLILGTNENDDVRIQTASRDISERKRIEEEHKRNIDREAELNDFQQTFVMMSSHQLRTPLTVIKSDVDLLKLMYEEDLQFDKNRILRIVSRMNTSINRMTYLMEDILTLGKLDAGTIEKHLEPVPILDCVKELVEEQFTPLNSGRTLRFEASCDEVIIHTDKDLLSQALANFIANADKYSEHGLPPELSISETTNAVLVKITDFGIGIPQEEMHKLYRAFYRGSNTKDYRGTGLGLRIAKNFLEIIDVNVDISSVEGKGTVVLVNIPKS